MERSFDLLKNKMEVVVVCLNGQFADVSDVYEEDRGASLDDAVSLVLIDPPYNTHREQNKNNSDHDVLSDDDMAEVSEILSKVLPKDLRQNYES